MSGVLALATRLSCPVAGLTTLSMGLPVVPTADHDNNPHTASTGITDAGMAARIAAHDVTDCAHDVVTPSKVAEVKVKVACERASPRSVLEFLRSRMTLQTRELNFMAPTST